MVPWLFLGIGFGLGKGSFIHVEQQNIYWPFVISNIVFTFLFRTIVCNIEFKKTGTVGYFSDSGNMMIMGCILGMIFKIIL